MNNLRKTEEIIALGMELTKELTLSKKNNDIYLIDLTKELLNKLKKLKESLEELN